MPKNGIEGTDKRGPQSGSSSPITLRSTSTSYGAVGKRAPYCERRGEKGKCSCAGCHYLRRENRRRRCADSHVSISPDRRISPPSSAAVTIEASEKITEQVLAKNESILRLEKVDLGHMHPLQIPAERSRSSDEWEPNSVDQRSRSLAEEMLDVCHGRAIAHRARTYSYKTADDVIETIVALLGGVTVSSVVLNYMSTNSSAQLVSAICSSLVVVGNAGKKALGLTRRWMNSHSMSVQYDELSREMSITLGRGHMKGSQWETMLRDFDARLSLLLGNEPPLAMMDSTAIGEKK